MGPGIESTVQKYAPITHEVNGVKLLITLIYATANSDVPVVVAIQRHPGQYPLPTRYLWQPDHQKHWESAVGALEYAKEQASGLLDML